MSRDLWYSAVGHNFSRSHAASDEERIQAFRHRKVSGETSDPQAADYDEAAELFFQGVQLARSGDLEAGCAQIATAYLLDGRSINFSLTCPQNPTLRALCVDLELLYLLADSKTDNLHEVSYGAHVLRFLLGTTLGKNQEMGQAALGGAMVSVNYLIQRLKEGPHLGAHHSQGGVLGGCMTWTNLLYQRSVIYMAIGNHTRPD